MATYKLQKPLTFNEHNIYPLTTVDQVRFDDGSKLEEKILTVDLNDTIEGEPALINADLLGGIAADQYALKSEADSGGLSPDVIANNLTTTEEGYVLDARQGYELKELIQQKASSLYFTVTLSKDGWAAESEEAPYTQTVSVEGISYGDRPIADIDMSEVTKSNVKEIQQNWSLIDRFVSSADAVTFYCYGDIPTIDLSVNLGITSNGTSKVYTYAEEATF